jgi:thermitase
MPEKSLSAGVNASYSLSCVETLEGKEVLLIVRKLFQSICLLLLAAQCGGANLFADSLNWRAKENRVDADIQHWDLLTLLEKVAGAANWEIYVQPGTTYDVSTKFKNLPADQALKLLLGKVNYALVPQSNALTKLYVFKTSAQDATQLIRRSPRIGNELIVTMKPGEDMEALAKKLGAKIVGRSGDTYRLRFADEDDAKNASSDLAENSDVSELDNNYVVDRRPDPKPSIVSSAPPPFNLTPNAGADSSHIVVGLIDSHVQGLAPEMQKFVLEGIDVVAGWNSEANQLTHGTSMAETVLQALALASNTKSESNVRILPVDVYGAGENTTTFDVAKGIVGAVKQGADIVNLSLGTSGNSTYLHNVITEASKQGVVFFSAAGNQPVTTPTYPAAYSEVISVTAKAPYANSGSWVNMAAPDQTTVRLGTTSYIVRGTSVSTAAATGLTAATADVFGKSPVEAATVVKTKFAFGGTK